MSIVTNIILTFSLMEDEGYEDDGATRMREINSHFGAKTGLLLLNAAEEVCKHGDVAFWGGTKALEHYVAIGAFNYVSLGDLSKHLREKVGWREPKNVRVMVCGQEDDAFRCYTLDELRAPPR